jgi:hypothetical protein
LTIGRYEIAGISGEMPPATRAYAQNSAMYR